MQLLRKTLATSLSFIINLLSNGYLDNLADSLFLDKLYNKKSEKRKGNGK